MNKVHEPLGSTGWHLAGSFLALGNCWPGCEMTSKAGRFFPQRVREKAIPQASGNVRRWESRPPLTRLCSLTEHRTRGSAPDPLRQAGTNKRRQTDLMATSGQFLGPPMGTFPWPPTAPPSTTITYSWQPPTVVAHQILIIAPVNSRTCYHFGSGLATGLFPAVHLVHSEVHEPPVAALRPWGERMFGRIGVR